MVRDHSGSLLRSSSVGGHLGEMPPDFTLLWYERSPKSQDHEGTVCNHPDSSLLECPEKAETQTCPDLSAGIQKARRNPMGSELDPGDLGFGGEGVLHVDPGVCRPRRWAPQC